MGQGGTLTLVNATSFAWNLGTPTSYQMESWDQSFHRQAAKVLPGSITQSIYIEFSDNIFKNRDDDAGEAPFKVLCPNNLSFEVQARSRPRRIQVDLKNVPLGSKVNSIVNLGWKQDGEIFFALIGPLKDGTYKAVDSGLLTPSQIPWMSNNLEFLGSRPLRHICIPGSHDSGTSQINGHTLFGSDPSIVNSQSVDIWNQLLWGARYFDIRPVIGNAGKYLTGHYSHLGGKLNWQGADGQYIDKYDNEPKSAKSNVIDDINRFTSLYPELIIINLSHAYDTDRDYENFTDDQWIELLRRLKRLDNLFISAQQDFSTLTLDTFLNGSKSAVIVTISDRTTLNFSDYLGFYPSSCLPTYNVYSDTNDEKKMANDQLSKMKTQRNSPDSSYFLLSWTLTQSGEDVASCLLWGRPSIIDLANRANTTLVSQLIHNISSYCYPNIIYIDNFNSEFGSVVTQLSLAINFVSPALSQDTMKPKI